MEMEMKMKKFAFIAGALFAMASYQASATVISFNSFSLGAHNGPLVTPEATFTSASGTIYVGAAGISHEICALNNNFNCEADMTVNFVGAVNNLSFVTSGWDSGDSVTVNVYDANGLLGSVLSASNGLVDLSAFANVTKLFLDDNSHGAGVAYDHYTFDAAEVPEPVSLALVAAGLVGLGAQRRKAAKQ